ncbi:protein of unknown function [Bradyrhizobium vignae]|uniref:Uncharacterized protein n=1 Tax=Bradyrhizobium vignae TaxID=1549949 RepID=A0A2U3PYF2_9BRAD|nr:protein of unknown function [Bradyrhizobium vignae]
MIRESYKTRQNQQSAKVVLVRLSSCQVLTHPTVSDYVSILTGILILIKLGSFWQILL